MQKVNICVKKKFLLMILKNQEKGETLKIGKKIERVGMSELMLWQNEVSSTVLFLLIIQYQEVEYRDLFNRTYPNTISDVLESQSCFNISSLVPMNHQGGNFCLENKIKAHKLIAPKGKISQQMCKILSRGLDEIVHNRKIYIYIYVNLDNNNRYHKGVKSCGNFPKFCMVNVYGMGSVIFMFSLTVNPVFRPDCSKGERREPEKGLCMCVVCTYLLVQGYI